MDILINLLNVNHQPGEQICVDSLLQTDFSPCVTQHLSPRSTGAPTSHFTGSRGSRAGMRRQSPFDPNVSSSWRVSDVTSSASVILGCFCLKSIRSLSVTERSWNPDIPVQLIFEFFLLIVWGSERYGGYWVQFSVCQNRIKNEFWTCFWTQLLNL